jgi:membrane protease YdiL (CAAX protease family)
MNIDALFDPLAIAILVITTLVFPFMGIWEFRMLRRTLARGRRNPRVPYYYFIVAVEWGLSILFLAWWFASGRAVEPLRLFAVPSGWQWIAAAAGVALSVLFIVQLIMVRRNREALAKVRSQVGKLEPMIPRSPAEQRAFTHVSLTAGICEEFLCRGVLLAVLASAFGTWPAVLVSSVIFGLGHAYQGATGIVKTGVIGLVMALLAVLSGSLWPAILFHATMDITSGRMLHAALTVPAEMTPTECA